MFFVQSQQQSAWDDVLVALFSVLFICRMKYIIKNEEHNFIKIGELNTFPQNRLDSLKRILLRKKLSIVLYITMRLGLRTTETENITFPLDRCLGVQSDRKQNFPRSLNLKISCTNLRLGIIMASKKISDDMNISAALTTKYLFIAKRMGMTERVIRKQF